MRGERLVADRSGWALPERQQRVWSRVLMGLICIVRTGLREQKCLLGEQEWKLALVPG